MESCVQGHIEPSQQIVSKEASIPEEDNKDGETQQFSEFKELQRLVDIRTKSRQTCMSSMLDQAGSETCDKDNMAVVFDGPTVAPWNHSPKGSPK